MVTTCEITEVLEYLIKINRDRVETYKRASYETTISDLKDIFSNMADESRKNITDLTKEIMNHSRIPDGSELTAVNEIYRGWRDTGGNQDFNTILSLCEFSESALMDIYTEAIAVLTNTASSELIERQEESLKSSLKVIKAYRNAYTHVFANN